MQDERILHNLRTMAWERAKGELYSMLHTFWEHIGEEHEKYLELSSSINRFITSVEDNGLHE